MNDAEKDNTGNIIIAWLFFLVLSIEQGISSLTCISLRENMYLKSGSF